MKIQRERLLILNVILQQAERIFKAPISGKFYYTVTRNRKIAEEERKLCYEAYPVDQKYLEYDQKRVGIYQEEGVNTDAKLRELSVKDAEKFNAIQERQRKLAEEYKEAIDAEAKMAEARDEFFKEDLEVDLRTVSSDELPEIDPKSGANCWEVFSRIAPIVKFQNQTESKKVTRDSLLRLNRILQQASYIFANDVSSKFYAAVVHNAEVTENERRLCYEAYPVDPKYIEYDNNRLAIFGEEGVTKDEQLREMAVKEPERFNAIQERQRKLAEEYKAAIDAENAMAIERDKYASEEVTVDLQIVSMDDVPELVKDEHINTWKVYDALSPMIDFAEETSTKE